MWEFKLRTLILWAIGLFVAAAIMAYLRCIPLAGGFCAGGVVLLKFLLEAKRPEDEENQEGTKEQESQDIN